MYHFIRNKENETLFDCSAYEEVENVMFKNIFNKELKKYSGLRKSQFEEDCKELENIGEKYNKKEDADDYVENLFINFCEEWQMSYVTD